MPDYKDAPYAVWLEDVVRTIFEQNPKSMVLCATLQNENTLTAYYECNAENKAVFAHHINSDAMLDVVLNNIGLIKNALNEDQEGAAHDGA